MERLGNIMMGIILMLLICAGIFGERGDKTNLSDLDRQGKAKAIIIGEFSIFSSLPKSSINSKYVYSHRPSYVQWLFEDSGTYESFRKYYLNRTREKDWTLVEERRSGENGELLFYKKLTKERGACELFLAYDATNNQFTARITWIEPMSVVEKNY